MLSCVDVVCCCVVVYGGVLCWCCVGVGWCCVGVCCIDLSSVVCRVVVSCVGFGVYVVVVVRCVVLWCVVVVS